MSHRDDQTWDELTGNTKIRKLREDMQRESRRTTKQWWVQGFQIIAGIGVAWALVVKVGACNQDGGWQFASKKEVAELRKDVNDLKMTLPQAVVDALRRSK